jgi:hypothetical protein
MKLKSFLICLVAAFATISATDYAIHQNILVPDYMASMNLWRSHETMEKFMSWIFVGELVVALGMTLLWLKTAAGKACWKCVLGFGFSTGLIGSAYAVTFYAVMPVPGALCAKWMVFGMLQALLTTAVLHLLTKSKAA